MLHLSVQRIRMLPTNSCPASVDVSPSDYDVCLRAAGVWLQTPSLKQNLLSEAFTAFSGDGRVREEPSTSEYPRGAGVFVFQ